jgi:O-antigen ligase
MEAVVLALAALAPWAFGSVDAVFELALMAGLAVLLLLWAALVVTTGRLTVLRCPVTLALALLFLVGLLQLLPLPPSLLGWVSPGSARLRADLYPTHLEELIRNEYVTAAPTYSPITVYPHATRVELVRWLAVLVLFAAVRNQIASTASMRRLALVMLVNGCLLSLFGLAQMFSAGSMNRVYWSYTTAGSVFGPFIYRNHFAAYINLCIALGVGLLLTLGPTEFDRKRRYMQKPNALEEQEEEVASVFAPLSVLHSPVQLWVCVALAVMLAGLVGSLSRGGVATLAISLVACVALRGTWPPRVRRLELLALPAVLLVGLLAWTGIRPLETRLAGLWKGDPLAEGRWQLWANLISLVPRFPVLGSGYGTLPYVEPLSRRQSDLLLLPDLLVDHAHNDYLEALVEGGVVRFGLTLALVGLVFTLGVRALRRHTGRTPGAWAFGGMLGFLALALHSTVDFGVTTPAVACLAAILTAQLVALSRSDPTVPPSAAHRRVQWLPLGALGRTVVAAVAVLLGGVLVLNAWRADRVYRLRLGAFQAVKQTKPPHLDLAIDYLEAAAHTDPTDAVLQVELGQTYLDARQSALQARQTLRRDQRLRVAAAAVAAVNAPAALADLLAWEQIAPPPSQAHKLIEKYVVPGLQHMATARRLCPLLARPHMRFAAHAAELVKADPPAAYWARARMLAPFDPDLWYFSGLQQLRDNPPDKAPDEAYASWRRSLELSGRHLNEIVDAAAARLDPASMLDKILPDNPELLLKAAQRLDNDITPDSPTKPLLARGRSLLNDRPPPLSASEYYLQARFNDLLGDADPALRAYSLALDMAPNQAEWRRDYVRLLIDQEKWAEASRQLNALPKQMRTKEVEDWEKLVKRRQAIQ